LVSDLLPIERNRTQPTLFEPSLHNPCHPTTGQPNSRARGRGEPGATAHRGTHAPQRQTADKPKPSAHSRPPFAVWLAPQEAPPGSFDLMQSVTPLPKKKKHAKFTP
jgi:hypothetical protein